MTAIYIFYAMSAIYILTESSCRVILGKLRWSVHSPEEFNCSRKGLITGYITFLGVAGEKFLDFLSLQRTLSLKIFVWRVKEKACRQVLLFSGFEKFEATYTVYI